MLKAIWKVIMRIELCYKIIVDDQGKVLFGDYSGTLKVAINFHSKTMQQTIFWKLKY